MRRRNVWLIATMILAAVAAAAIGFFAFSPVDPRFGVTFSSKYAHDLGLDWRAAYVATLDDLGVDTVRFPVYWNAVEAERDAIVFDDVDWAMDIALRRDVDVTLAIGMKVPRWPECALPEWAKTLSNTELEEEVVELVNAFSLRYREHPALARWQVENEPLFWYGECPLPDLGRLKHEVAAVRANDISHPIVLTSSGEQATWLELASLADVVGVSLYRFAWNPALGPVVFPHSPLYYRLQHLMVRAAGGKVVISELQMEPWFEDGTDAPDGRTIAFTAGDFAEHIRYASETGIEEIWLWGVEWWYREHLNQRSDLWNAARELFVK